MKFKVLYHNYCFDGVCSAVVFSCFYRKFSNLQIDFMYDGLLHRPGNLFENNLLDADKHAIVDFKYNNDPAITWWFDHHQSAFLSKSDEEHFYSDTSGKKFYNSQYKSCTKFIADIAREKFSISLPELKDLICWADLIDGAQYDNAETAINLEAPAKQLALVIESCRDQLLLSQIIEKLQYKSIQEVCEISQIQKNFSSLLKRHERAAEIISKEGRFVNGVVFFDVSDYDIEGYSKFIAYYLFPQARYSVGISKTSLRSKISVGYNPWSGQPHVHNLASICEYYGGGGHSVVGAISYSPDELERARQVAMEIVNKLCIP